jgi:hypothetical protein
MYQKDAYPSCHGDGQWRMFVEPMGEPSQGLHVPRCSRDQSKIEGEPL